MTSSNGNKNTYVRVARPEDFNEILDVATRAFINDPVMLFLGNVSETKGTSLFPKDEQGLRTFLSFFLKSCASRKGRITVVVLVTPDNQSTDPHKGVQTDSSESPKSKREQIISATLWYPPRQRIYMHQALKLVQAGVLSVLQNWGVNWFWRSTQYLDKFHSEFTQTYLARGIAKSKLDNTWYLAMAFTDPAFQGQGLLSMLMKDQFAFAPNETHILEASSEKSRSVYTRYGFESQGTVTVGEGRVASTGLRSRGKAAIGVNVYPMIKWGSA